MWTHRPLRALILATAAAVTTVGTTPPSTAGQASDGHTATYVVEFLSHDPPNDWASIARQLVERQMVEIEVEEIVGSPCKVVLERLGFRDTDVPLGCSEGIARLITDIMSGKVGEVHVPPGHVAFPHLPITSTGIVQTYDKRLDDERRRCLDIGTQWDLLAKDACQTTPGPLGFVELQAYEMTATVPDTADNRSFMQSLRRFNPALERNDIEVYRDGEEQAYGGSNSADPTKWLEDCTAVRPGYATLLGLPTTPSCDCSGQCTRIILFDREPAPHPSIAHKLGRDAVVPKNAPQCLKVDEFDRQVHHATHLAGILVSRDDPGHFSGLTPWAELAWRDHETGMPFIDIGEVRQTNRAIRDFSQPGRMKVILFASAWKYDDPNAADELRSDPNFRLNTPQYVQSIIHGPHLWVVAAGNRNVNISKEHPESPMNIGDQKNIIVVAACRDCESQKARLTDYSNFSDEGLVHVAAYGGEFPAPATSTEYALASGTSQASALVAGLVTSMTCAWPDAYRTPREIKVRILSAVHPPIDRELRAGVTGGVVDARKALLDPRVHHVAAHGDRPRRASRLRWCVPTLRPEALHTAGEAAPGDPVEPELLRHIVGYDTSDGDRAFFLFHEFDAPQEQAAGRVRRTGPGLFPNDPPLVRVTYADGGEPSEEVLKAGDIDFILTPPQFVDGAEVSASEAACR